MTQQIHLGFGLPLIGTLIDRLLPFALPIAELRRHMREEHRNLARLLEEPTRPDSPA